MGKFFTNLENIHKFGKKFRNFKTKKVHKFRKNIHDFGRKKITNLKKKSTQFLGKFHEEKSSWVYLFFMIL